VKLVIFGLTVSSSWGNGHATLWRGLCAALGRLGHHVVFFERDVPYYAQARDLTELPGGGELVLYSDWQDLLPAVKMHLKDADVAMVTSYCPDGIDASAAVLDSDVPLRVFYDLDAPVTLFRLAKGETLSYVGSEGYRDFDLVLSYTGGKVLEQLQSILGARTVAPLYGSVDPEVHRPGTPDTSELAALSYMGTWSADRDDALRTVFIEPARLLPDKRFVIGGAQYTSDFPWLPNIYFVNHLAPAQHSGFYASSRLTLNVTRKPMAALGYCPSGRLFEAAACGVPVLSDHWEGLDTFYEPGTEILLAETTEDAVNAVNRSPEELAAIARAARERTLECHTADVRARELERILEQAYSEDTQRVKNACGA